MTAFEILSEVVAVGTVTSSLAVKLIGIPDQLLIIRRRRSVEGLSLRNESLGFCAYTFWMMHGLLTQDWVIIASQCLGVMMSGAVLAQFVVFRAGKENRA